MIPGISVTAPIRRSTPWAFIRKNCPFVPTIEMSTLFAFPSKNQLNAQGAVTENPGTHVVHVKLSNGQCCQWQVCYWQISIVNDMTICIF